MARTSQATREDVKLLWAELNELGHDVSGVELQKRLKSKNGGRNVRSLRAVQGDVRIFKDDAQHSGKPFNPAVWDKWGRDVVSPGSLPCVLLVNAVSHELTGNPLRQHEAIWAERIHLALRTLDPVTAWFLVWSYALQEVVQRVLHRKTASTFHLDQLIAHQPWKPENRSTWNLWVQSRRDTPNEFHTALEYLAEQHVPKGVDRELARWATRQLIGPWDSETGIAWDWHSLLERKYGQQSKSKED